VHFSIVADYFQRIEATSSRLDMTYLLAELLGQATAQEAEIISNLLLGQLRPPYVGTQFNIASKNLIKVIVVLQNESESEVKEKMQQLGDLGLVVASGGWSPKDILSVLDVYNRLDTIERIHGVGSSDDKNSQLVELLEHCDPISAKYIVRIILGKLRLGFSDMTLIDALSWMHKGDKSLKNALEHAYNMSADIGLIAKTLKESGIEGIEAMQVHVGIPIRPAAAERLPTAQAVVDKLGHCVAQPKLDGFRLQIHLDKSGDQPQIRFFSRNLIDMSHMFPDLTAAVAQLPVKNIICEGEAIVYDPNTKLFLPFQETVKRKRKHDIEEVMEEFPLRVYLFDLLYLNGKSLMPETHMMRREQLLAVMDDYHNETVQVIDERFITTGKELLHYFQENISAGLEGLVVKRPDSVYTPGKRNFNWIKLKREEEGHLDDTIDCVILGYYFGEGKRADFGIGAFLVGVYNSENDMFQTIAKVGTGLKDDDWRELKRICDQMVLYGQPRNVSCAKELTPDVWVSPEKVCMIRADEITLSPVHTANKTEDHLGFALRFPRFMGYRFDKSAKDATTVDEMKSLFEIQVTRSASA
jgi:DNA ligase-1